MWLDCSDCRSFECYWIIGTFLLLLNTIRQHVYFDWAVFCWAEAQLSGRRAVSGRIAVAFPVGGFGSCCRGLIRFMQSCALIGCSSALSDSDWLLSFKDSRVSRPEVNRRNNGHLSDRCHGNGNATIMVKMRSFEWNNFHSPRFFCSDLYLGCN